MLTNIYRYEFAPPIAIDEVEATLLLALTAAETLHGASQVRLDAEHAFDPVLRVCVMNAATEVGRDLNKLFAGFLSREFGAGAFRVERIAPEPSPAV
ncbi:MAG: hypothetical protein U0791_14950 [Gemmataceae bacterium]